LFILEFLLEPDNLLLICPSVDVFETGSLQGASKPIFVAITLCALTGFGISGIHHPSQDQINFVVVKFFFSFHNFSFLFSPSAYGPPAK
jgi:hypothetical protein